MPMENNNIVFNKKFLAIILISLSTLFEIIMFTFLRIVQSNINVYTTIFLDSFLV